MMPLTVKAPLSMPICREMGNDCLLMCNKLAVRTADWQKPWRYAA